MNIGKRTILWVGAPCSLVRLRAGPFSPNVLSIDRGPAVSTPSAGGEERAAPSFDSLLDWISPRVGKGETVDIVYQHHLMIVEAFPRMEEEDLQDALKVRLATDLVFDEDDLLSRKYSESSDSTTFGVVSAVLASRHRVLVKAVVDAGGVEGRVGFAGNLVLRLLKSGSTNGSWALLRDLACSQQVILATGSEGQILVADLSHRGQGAVREAHNLLGLHFPRASFSETPQNLFQSPSKAFPELLGPRLPKPLPQLLPVFLADARGRIPSQEDIDYPHYLSLVTWVFLAVYLFMGGYLAVLTRAAWDQGAIEGQLASDKLQTDAFTRKAEAVKSRLVDLDNLQDRLFGIESEVFDNGKWLWFIAQQRDAHAKGLLFDSVTVRGTSMTLAGSHSDGDAVLALVQSLKRAMGEAQVRLPSLSTATGGRRAFSLTLTRASPLPPGNGSTADDTTESSP